MNSIILAGNHLKKTYGKNTVLKDVSLQVVQGQIYGLIGKNGSGKTTLLRVLTGLIQDYSGTVTLNNEECRIAAAINEPALFLNMTAFENLKGQAILLGLSDDDRIEEALKMVGLEDCGCRQVKNFSLGMTQRLKLAMALLEKPDLLILDEPINGLDPDGIADLRNLLRHLNEKYGITIIISSHILSELEHTATCFGILYNGEIVKEISEQELQQQGTNLETLYMQHTRGENYHVENSQK